MPVKRRRIERTPASHITPEVLSAFAQCKKLARQCRCTPLRECEPCQSWWKQMAIIRNALKLPPHFWPCIPNPNAKVVSPAAQALYAELEDALGA